MVLAAVAIIKVNDFSGRAAPKKEQKAKSKKQTHYCLFFVLCSLIISLKGCLIGRRPLMVQVTGVIYKFTG